jgi:hypothetical protein
VRVLGIDIGRITDVDNAEGKVRVTMLLDEGTKVPADATAAVADALLRLAASTDPLDRVTAVQLGGLDSWSLLETASWDGDARVRDAVKLQLERVIATGGDVDRAWRMIDRLASG